LDAGAFDAGGHVGGFELEAWLLDRHFFPNPINQADLARLHHPLVVPELSTFNVELNGTPQRLGPGALRALEEELDTTWRRCVAVAHDLESTLIMIGILPTIREFDLNLAHMSPLNRYYALNERIVSLRAGRPLRLDIDGRERLVMDHADIMLEAATTSFQVHVQIAADEFARYYNTSLLLSAPLVALAANSPYLFEHDLWDETRIALFEQAVDGGDAQDPDRCRVTFGQSYLERSALECFRDNARRFPVLLPVLHEAAPRALAHLRLHNGTIWRWNRPLSGFDGTGTPHLRLEQRVMPAGPSVLDMVANAALYAGALRALATLREPVESALPFATVRESFYRAAREGLGARITWIDGSVADVRTVLLEELIPLAREGLRQLEIGEQERDRYLDVVASRVRSGQNGATWQRAFVDRHGRDFFRLTAAYLEHQRSAMPVHEWSV
ncbi:MAG: glutamate--cysteine ligase, partial [Gammaproteobacteria bacterium]|nr:glutamate--cysteine ligase [Gammaproteobacteria bacterium]